MGNNILLVDDEKAVLRALQRPLTAGHFNVFLADDAGAALDILGREPIDIIISDMRMPRINGHQLLRQVRDRYPGTIRLILSGYADEKEIARAMMDGSCKMYLLKPWDNQQLTKLVGQLLAVKERLSGLNLLGIINQLDGLSTLPQIYNKLMDLVDRDADLKQIAAVVEEDPPTAAKVLQVVNSAFYGIKTGSVAQALSYIGLGALRGIILSACCLPAGQAPAAGPFSAEAVWRQACLASRLTSGLHQRLLGRHIPEAASTAGLLFDLGRLVLLRRFPAQYARIVTLTASQPAAAFSDLERETLGLSHLEIGGYLLEWWNLPQPIVECALYHEDPLNEDVIDRQIVGLVHIAGHYARRALGARYPEKFDPRVFALLGTDKAGCEAIINDLLPK